MKIITPVLCITGLFISLHAFGQGNGKLQIHFMNVGQGDGALLISPGGETVLFDDGDTGDRTSRLRAERSYHQRLKQLMI